MSRSLLGRSLPFIVLFWVCLLAMSVGVSAQTPIENAAGKLVQIATNVAPYLATLAFIAVGLLLAVGHHEAHSRLVQVCFGVAIALGAISIVNYFR